MIEGGSELFESVERGQGVYMVIYKNNRPDELYFLGYSFD
jgi:hypothetical protein